MDLDALVSTVSRRPATTKGGIALASRYVGSLVSCAGDAGCAARRLGTSTPAQWEGAIKDAKSRLVYRNEDMAPAMTRRAGAMFSRDGYWRARGAVRQDGSDARVPAVTPGACLDFTCVITSTRQDRDGDVLETSGARPDPKMPLLWQHIPLEPIGKLVRIISQTPTVLSGLCSIVDSPLGRDAAQLVEFGALRISHGFKPIKFEPLTGTRQPGFRVTEFEILEVSLVSVPSNVDAEIAAFSRGKLFHPAVKSWCQGLKDQLPALVTGGWVDPESPWTDPGDDDPRFDGHRDLPGPSPTRTRPIRPLGGDGAAATTGAGTTPKEGRTLSAKNVKRCKAAMDHLEAAMGHTSIPAPCKTMCRAAHGLIKDMHDEASGPAAQDKPAGQDKPGAGGNDGFDEEKGLAWLASKSSDWLLSVTLARVMVKGHGASPGAMLLLGKELRRAADAAEVDGLAGALGIPLV